MGEPELLLDYAAENKLCDDKIINIMKTFMKVVENNETTFKAMLNNPQELKKYEENIAKFLISPVIEFCTDELTVLFQLHFLEKRTSFYE